jgi:hypothetical protein
MKRTVERIDPKVAHQLELERLYNKNQTISRIRKEFENFKLADFRSYMVEKEIDPDFGMDLLIQMVLHKRTTLSTMVGILRKHFEPHPKASQMATDMLLKAIDAELVDWHDLTKQLVVLFNISDEVQADLDLYQFPLPMVVHPLKVKTNRETGYYLSKNSLILRKNHHEEDICLDHINRVNDIKFTINYDTAHMVRNQWRNMDKPKEGESRADFQRRLKAFEKYDRSSKEVIEKLLQYGNEFWLTHKYDKRGRVYCQGYHINYQGAPWNKAVIELADKEVVPL